MRTQQQGRIPIPPIRLFSRFLPRLDIHRLSAPPIVPHQPAILPLAVNDVWIFRIDLRLIPVPAHRDEPILVRNPGPAPRPRRPTLRVVVLRASVYEIKRNRVVDADPIELRQRKVGHVRPILGPVVGLVRPAVTTDPHVPVVFRVDPQGMIVHVPEPPRDPLDCLAAVLRHVHKRVQRVNPVDVDGIANDLVVVLRARTHVIIALVPGFPAIRRTEESTLVVRRLDDRVHYVWIRRRHVQPDASLVHIGHAARQLPPRLSRIGRLVDRRLRPAVDQRPDAPPPLIRRGVQHPRIARIHMYLVHTRIVADVQHALPRLAAVGGLVQPPVSA